MGQMIFHIFFVLVEQKKILFPKIKLFLSKKYFQHPRRVISKAKNYTLRGHSPLRLIFSAKRSSQYKFKLSDRNERDSFHYLQKSKSNKSKNLCLMKIMQLHAEMKRSTLHFAENLGKSYKSVSCRIHEWYDKLQRLYETKNFFLCKVFIGLNVRLDYARVSAAENTKKMTFF